MTKVLRDAIAGVEALPESEQDRIARELIDYLDSSMRCAPIWNPALSSLMPAKATNWTSTRSCAGCMNSTGRFELCGLSGPMTPTPTWKKSGTIWRNRLSSRALMSRVYKIVAACRQLSDWPFSGRARDGLIPGMRSVVSAPYVIFYGVGTGAVEIVRVLHGRRDIEAVFTAES